MKGGDGDGKGDASSAVLRTVDLGQGKSVALYVPSDVADVAGDRIARENLERFRDALYGAGDVVWPASIALARLVSHCPSLVAGKRVLEIGAGLGLVGTPPRSRRRGGSQDLDADVLQLARRSVPENIPEDPSSPTSRRSTGPASAIADAVRGAVADVMATTRAWSGRHPRAALRQREGSAMALMANRKEQGMPPRVAASFELAAVPPGHEDAAVPVTRWVSRAGGRARISEDA